MEWFNVYVQRSAVFHADLRSLLTMDDQFCANVGNIELNDFQAVDAVRLGIKPVAWLRTALRQCAHLTVRQ
jgi:hypothetical protein